MMVLDLVPQGKAVIRPIAFRPLQGAGGSKSHSGHAGHGQAPAAARLSNAGERYGSTPVLARPGTRLALHGSKYPARYRASTHGCSRSMQEIHLSSFGISLPSTRKHREYRFSKFLKCDSSRRNLLYLHIA